MPAPDTDPTVPNDRGLSHARAAVFILCGVTSVALSVVMILVVILGTMLAWGIAGPWLAVAGGVVGSGVALCPFLLGVRLLRRYTPDATNRGAR